MSAAVAAEPVTAACDRPGCGHPEDWHELCGCQDCGNCPAYLSLHTCEHCGTQYAAKWRMDAHRRFRPEYCRAAEAETARKVAERARRDARHLESRAHAAAVEVLR